MTTERPITDFTAKEQRVLILADAILRIRDMADELQGLGLDVAVSVHCTMLTPAINIVIGKQRPDADGRVSGGED